MLDNLPPKKWRAHKTLLWTVKQRFSTLDAMRHGLWKKRLPLPDVPFPRKQAPLLMFVHKWHAPGTLAMPAEEMEERREGLQAYLSELSGLKDSWRSDVVTEVLCLAEDDATSASASPAGNQANEAQPPSSSALPPPVTKAVSWVDQQTPATALTDFAARPDEAPHCTPRSPPPPPPPVSALSSSSKLTPPSLSLSSPKPTAEAAAVAAGAPTSSTTTPGGGAVSASDSPDAASGSVLEETRDADVGEGSAAAAMGAPAAAAAAAPEDSTPAAADSCEEKGQEPTAFLSPPKGPADAAADAAAVADGPAASLLRTEPRLLTRRVRERARKRLEQQLHAATAAKPGSGGGYAPADTAAVDPIPVADSAAISTPPVSLPSSPIRPAPFTADEPGEARRVSQSHDVVSVSSSPAAAEQAEKTSGVPPAAAIPGDVPATACAVASPAGETTAAEGERNTGGGEEEEDGGAEGAATVQQPGIPSTAEKGETQGAAGSSGGGEKEEREAAAEGGLPESMGTPGAEVQAGESLLPSLLLSAPTAVLTAAAVLAAEIAAEKPEDEERLGQQTEPPLSDQTSPATALPATETAGSQEGQTEESVAVAAAPVEDQTLAEDEGEASGSEGASAVVATAAGGDTAEIAAEKPEDEERLGQQTEPPLSDQTSPATALPATETAGSQEGQTEESVAVAASPVEDQSLAEDEGGASGSEGASAVVATATGGHTAEITAEEPEDEERLGQYTEPPLSDQTSPATALPATETAGSQEGQTEESVAVAAAPVEDQSLAEDEGGASGSEGASTVVAAATGGGTSPAGDYTVTLSALDAQDPSDSGSEEASAEVSAAKGSAAPVDGRTPAPPAEEVAAEMQEGPPAEHAAAEDSGADAQTLSILAVAAAAADAAVEQEGREERDRGHASAVSALTLSSATEDYTEEGESREANVCCADGAAAAPGELAGQTVDAHPPTSLPTPTTATKGRASLLNRARWSLSSKKATADTKQKDAAGAGAAAAAGGVNPAEDLAQEEAAAAAAAPSKPLSLSSTTTPTAAGPSAFTPRTASRLASLRNKARGWRKSRGSGGGGGRDSEGSGPLSDGRAGGSSRGSGSGPLSGRRSLGAVARRRTVSGPLSLSSARSGKGGSKGFFSSMSKSPEAAAGDSDGHKGEEGLPAPGEEETGGGGGVSPGGLAPASGSATGNPAQTDSDDGALAPVGAKDGPAAAGGGGGSGFDGFAVPPSPSEG
ncbi:hypothetical protein Esi_0041_0139 [Ectocarpus siliculosus]|uniref:PX domain-containing protein n=1 Tax=Ectocarpus siliculosus TaxID=2880 RepID=D8LMX4_ECTSI|nr:hypothetical protein Esi_0041_0139 [Ectocarpus siliculosus]|eukprot:CBN74775.1 hypothetical protein Esi_0041_0139 [Ectocarpus siliculosus]